MDTKPKEYVQAAFEVARSDDKVDRFKKFGEIQSRSAVEGEEIVTVIEGEEETKNTAKKGDMVIRTKKNGAEYIIGGKKFEDRYEDLGSETDRDGYSKYKATGETYAFKYEGETFKFVAPWGEDMIVNDGDYICAPNLEDLDDIYRIEKGEFIDTYERASENGDVEEKAFVPDEEVEG